MNLAETRSHQPLVNKPKAKKAKKPVRKVGKKMAALKLQYMKLREYFLLRNPWCEWCWNELDRRVPATEIHHVRRRGKYLLDVSTWKAVSRDAHIWIHNHPKESKEKGYLI